jgi:hypothetical protein
LQILGAGECTAIFVEMDRLPAELLSDFFVMRFCHMAIPYNHVISNKRTNNMKDTFNNTGLAGFDGSF